MCTFSGVSRSKYMFMMNSPDQYTCMEPVVTNVSRDTFAAAVT